MSTRLLEIANDQDNLSERFDHFEMKLVRRLTSAEARLQVGNIIDALAELPARDKFALAVEISGDALTISDPSERNLVTEHIDSHHEDGESVEFRIEVIKTVALQRLSVYSLAALGAYLDRTPLSDAMGALAKRFQGRLIFECYSGTPGAGSATLRFVKAGETVPDADAPLAWRSRSMALLQDNAYLTGSTGNMLPQDFAVLQPVGVAPLDAFMARAGAVLSAMFLSNMSDFRGNQLGYRITGYKLLTGTVANLADLVDDAGSFLRIAIWACGAEGSSDKIGLARNVISLCVQRLEDVPAHPEIWDAIQSNYQIYLKENITTYLEVRNKLAELLAESTHKTHSLAEGLLDSIRNGVLIVLTFLLTVVVINGLKDTGVQVIFSTEYLAIVLALLVLISLAVWASCHDALSRFNQSATATSQLLKRMYAHVMIATEIEEQVDPTIADNRIYLNRQAQKYQIVWLIFAVLVALAFVAGHWCFGRASKITMTPTTETESVSGPTPARPKQQGIPAPDTPSAPQQPPIFHHGDLPTESLQGAARQVQVAAPPADSTREVSRPRAEKLPPAEGSDVQIAPPKPKGNNPHSLNE